MPTHREVIEQLIAERDALRQRVAAAEADNATLYTELERVRDLMTPSMRLQAGIWDLPSAHPGAALLAVAQAAAKTSDLLTAMDTGHGETILSIAEDLLDDETEQLRAALIAQNVAVAAWREGKDA